jgi:Ca2+/H+ antiporter
MQHVSLSLTGERIEAYLLRATMESRFTSFSFVEHTVMRRILLGLLMISGFAFLGCTVKVEEKKPTPVVDKDVDVKVDVPGVKVDVSKD